jgi:hypothetical protein
VSPSPMILSFSIRGEQGCRRDDAVATSTRRRRRTLQVIVSADQHHRAPSWATKTVDEPT